MNEKRFVKVRGELYPCKPDIFHETYEMVYENGEGTIDSNEQLKKDELITDYKKLEKENEQLKEENEQLKKENNDYEKQFRIINEKLDEYIKTADTYRIPISSLEYGDDLGYFNGVYQYMKKLKKDIGGIGYE